MNSSPRVAPRVWQHFLFGSWRETLPPLALSSREWETLAPHVVGSRIAAMAWRRLRDSELSAAPDISALHEQHRVEWMRARVQSYQLEFLIQTLRAQNIEPVLIKGWVHALNYADTSLRPAGDIDLCVKPAQLRQAVAILKAVGGESVVDTGIHRVRNERLAEETLVFPDAPAGWYLVELHGGLADLNAPGDASWDELVARGRDLALGDTTIRVLAPEDHLRLAAIHFLRHEADRPLWLCDLSAALEARSPDWNWNQCLGNNQTRANWVSCALALARDLTGVSLEGTPLDDFKAPAWLAPHVVQQWTSERERPTSQPMWYYLRPLSRVWLERSALRREFVKRWPSPIFAMLGCRHRLDASPRFLWQTLYFAQLSNRFIRHLPHFARNRPRPL